MWQSLWTSTRAVDERPVPPHNKASMWTFASRLTTNLHAFLCRNFTPSEDYQSPAMKTHYKLNFIPTILTYSCRCLRKSTPPKWLDDTNNPPPHAKYSGRLYKFWTSPVRSLRGQSWSRLFEHVTANALGKQTSWHCVEGGFVWSLKNQKAIYNWVIRLCIILAVWSVDTLPTYFPWDERGWVFDVIYWGADTGQLDGTYAPQKFMPCSLYKKIVLTLKSEHGETL